MALAVPLSRFTPRVGGGSAFFVRLIMRSIYLSIFAALLTGCAAAPESHTRASTSQVLTTDPIDQLVTKLSSEHLWQNGASPILDLPETASTEQVVKKVFEMTGFDRGHVKSYTILKVREVQIQGGLFSAALVQTDIGEKIVLFTKGGGWSRVYDI